MPKIKQCSIIEFFESKLLLNIQTLSPAQKVILKAIVGEPLDHSKPIRAYHDYIERNFSSEVDLFLFLSGKEEYVPGKIYTDLSLDAGRRSGKSNLIGAGLAVYFATQRDYSPYLGTSPFATMPIISPTREQAGEVYAAIKNFFLRSPYLFHEYLNGEVTRVVPEYDEESTDERRFVGGQIRLNNNVVIKTLAADVSRIRGFAVPFYILDEACWFGTEGSDSKNTDVAINEAIQPATAQFGDLAFGLKISSPNGEVGMMFNDYQNRKDSDVLHLQAPTWYMNPNISVSYLEKQRKKGLHYFNREYGAQYVASENAYLDPKLVEQCLIPGIDQIPYEPEFRYVAAMDYATKDDYWTFAIGHKEYRTLDVTDGNKTRKEKFGVVIIDVLKHWRGSQGAELDPSQVVIEIAQFMREYKVAYSLADQYAFAALKTLMQQEGQNVKEFAFSMQSKKKFMYSLQVAINSATLKFVNNRLAVKHLKDLREKRTASGTIKIGHAQGSKDDYADSIALIVYQFDKSSPVYIGHTKDDETTISAQTKDALGKFISMPTAQDLADHVGIAGFSDRSPEFKGKEKIEEEKDKDDGNFWFIF